MLKKITFLIVTTALACTSAIGQLVFEPELVRDIGFPDTQVNQESVINYTATSRGNGPWTVRLNTNNQVFAANPNQFVVQNGQAVRFTLSFAPQQEAQYNAILNGSYDNGQGAGRISSNLTGRGVRGGPSIEVSPNSVDLALFVDELGTIWQDTNVDVLIINNGDAALNIQSISDPVDWLVCDHNAFAVQPGDWVEVTFSVPDGQWQNLEPDIYETTITVTSNDNAHARLQIPVSFDRGLIPHYLITFGDNQPETNHALLVDNATIEGQRLSIYDEVGVVTPRGDLAGSEYFDGDWPIPILAWGDDANAGFAGFRANDAFAFRIWDASTQREYAATARFSDGPDRYAADAISALTITATPGVVEQIIPLRAGWDMISLRIRPEEHYWLRQEGPDILRLFESVVDHTQLVKDGMGRFYYPSRNFNSIPYLPLERGLLVRMSQADTLILRGTAIDPGGEIGLTNGWNLISYYPGQQMTMGVAFGDLTRRNLLTIAKDAFGRFYLPAANYGSGNQIAPNSGLLVNVNENCAFRYPANQIAGLLAPNQIDEDTTVHFRPPKPTDGNMSILIESLDGIIVRRNAELACLTPDGVVAGATVLSGPPPWGMAAWGDDSFTENIIEGFRVNEPLRFMYYDGRHEWEWEVGFDVIDGGQAIYATNGFLVIGAHVDVKDGDIAYPAELALMPPAPNPFNSTTQIEFSLPASGQATLTLFDLYGREQQVIASGLYEAGAHRVALDGGSIANGIYLLVLTADDRRLTQRVVLMK